MTTSSWDLSLLPTIGLFLSSVRCACFDWRIFWSESCLLSLMLVCFWTWKVFSVSSSSSSLETLLIRWLLFNVIFLIFLIFSSPSTTYRLFPSLHPLLPSLMLSTSLLIIISPLASSMFLVDDFEILVSLLISSLLIFPSTASSLLLISTLCADYNDVTLSMDPSCLWCNSCFNW